MWDLPESGIKPMSPALAGRFFTPEPPGKPCFPLLLLLLLSHFSRVRLCKRIDSSPPGSSIHGIFQYSSKSTGVGCHCLLRHTSLVTCYFATEVIIKSCKSRHTIFLFQNPLLCILNKNLFVCRIFYCRALVEHRVSYSAACGILVP